MPEKWEKFDKIVINKIHGRKLQALQDDNSI